MYVWWVPFNVHVHREGVEPQLEPFIPEEAHKTARTKGVRRSVSNCRSSVYESFVALTRPPRFAAPRRGARPKQPPVQ